MRLNSTLKRVRGLLRKTRKNTPLSGGMIRKPRFKLSPSAAAFVPSSFTAPAPVETKEEKEVMKALVSSMAAANIDTTKFMSMAMNTITKFNAVAMDCEMVGVGEGGKTSALAHIAIVDLNGNILMNEYVIPRGGITTITDYRTDYSGISENTYKSFDRKKRERQSFNNIRKKALKILQGKIIVGHGLKNDFDALEVNMSDYITWDTATKEEHQKTHPIYGKQARKLKSLAAEIGNIIQVAKSDKRGHSPVEDARASMNLYRHYILHFDKVPYANMTK
jgi:RNA exonuclease 4